ncbi:Short chain dehydrogenase nor1 [Hyphodiscus hymeniophilus]|uniref:Short chain dehydrogenase nor1 n=1 Tax=Hyphodiscus hymeniophilus TaxID=353542 RepID=A0A9P6VT10_9HELO|nr:Short chain dehydrogenase nor1 [Hyphodiscus hymeniophilus]
MSLSTVFLITGANRGIGLALTGKLLVRVNTTVIATIRSVATDVTELERLPIAAGSRLMLTTLSSTSDASGAAMIQELSAKGVTHIDTIIANAGWAHDYQPCLTTSVGELRSTFEVNTVGPVKLFQAAFPLLQKSACAKFILISSILGSIGAVEGKEPSLAYGASKAAANYLVRKVHFEHEDIVTLAVHPGWLKTGMGQGFADVVGVPEPTGNLEQSIDGILAQINVAFKTTTSGSFVSYDGTIIPW